MDVYSAFKQFLVIKELSFTEGDHYLSFRYNEWNYVLLYDQEDPFYFRLALPRLAPTSPDDLPLLKEALSLSAHYRVAKAVVLKDEIWLLFEAILGESEVKNSYLFERAVAILSSFAIDIKKLQEKDENSEEKIEEKKED